jgi:MarR family transcriptional regulator, transcriptional regulator for hemolysin
MDRKNMPLGMIFGRIMQDMFRVLRKRASESENIILTNEQFSLLHVINMRKGKSVQQDFANMLGKDKSAILRLIDSLENKGLVMRVADANDRRKNCLELTDAGKELNKRYMKMEEQISKELTGKISQSDMEAFYRVVLSIWKNIEEI